MVARIQEARPLESRHHLKLVDSVQPEYDEDFMGESGFEVKIIFQGKDVVKNRRRLLAEMTRRATTEII